MCITSMAELFRKKWEARVGAESTWAQTLSPRCHDYRRLLAEAPVSAVAALLKGMSATVSESPQAPRESVRLRWWLPAVAAGLAGGLAAALHLPWWVSVPTTTALCAAAGFCVLKQQRPAVAAPLPKATPGLELAALEEAMACFQRMMDQVMARVQATEEDAKLGYDLTDSKSLGEWIRKFVDLANAEGASPDLVRLESELVSKLQAAGITVYDRILRDAQGVVRLPDAEFFRDERPDGVEAFTRVVHAVVTSRRGLLAAGELA